MTKDGATQIKRSAYKEGKKEAIAEVIEDKAQPGQTLDLPEQINTPRRRALYCSLNQDEDLAIKIDEAVNRARPNGCRGRETLERVIKYAIWEILQDRDEVERIFRIVEQEAELCPMDTLTQRQNERGA